MSIEHKHILINAKITYQRKDPLDTYQEAVDFLDDLVESIGMKKLMGPLASYVTTPGNQGVTAIVGIETSHIAFHIWDEEMPARLQFDLYTCGPLDKDIVINKVKERFGVLSADYRIYDRETGFVLLEEGTL
jgi:S-adenosylmethionine/arginine decarboxylase-like enzyme